MVQVEVRVTSGGQPVHDLTPADFRLLEDGVEQRIEYFHHVCRGPSSPVAPAVTEAVSGSGAEHGSQPLVEPTWVYLSTEIGSPQDARRAAASLRTFLGKELPPGFLVSVAGSPFTANRQLLVRIVERLAREPYGRPAAVGPVLQHEEDLEFLREIAKAQSEEMSAISTMTGFEREPEFRGALSQVPTLNAESVDRQILFFGQLALMRYRDLVRSIGDLPGRKVVVLYRSGLRLDPEHYQLMQEIIAEATRHRLTFYTMDSRGLDTIPPLEDRRYAIAWQRGTPRDFLPNILGKHERLLQSREGLVAIAQDTNGRAVLDTNDLGEVLETVRTDSAEYYVFGYYPTDLSERGRFRRWRIETLRQGLKLQAPRGYYEHNPQGQPSSVFELLQRELTPGDLTLQSQVNFFAGPDQMPLLVFSLGTAIGGLEGRRSRGQTRLEATLAARLHLPGSRNLPIYHYQVLSHSLPADQFAQLDGDPTVVLAGSSLLPVSPGRYRWKAAIRDERSGRWGTEEVDLTVPDFRVPSTPSSLLLTREVRRVPADASGTEDPRASVLRVADLEFVPQPQSVFRKGEILHALFDLYLPSSDDLAEAAHGMQLLLLREGRPVNGVEAYGQAHVQPEQARIRYAAHLSTASLEPGMYRLVAFLPNSESRSLPALQRFFRLVESSGRVN
ncbi:MAG: hypothetical protein Kow001_23860 [Acidobacteriota bacterium]